jgi:uncharacterized coiled-coil DUF342 family protein
MDANDLLAVSPKLLAQAILHRRERLADMIPDDLEARKTELAEAEPLAKSARESRDGINSKVAGLKTERNSAQKKARTLFEKSNGIREQLIAEGSMKNPDPKWAQDKLSEKLQSIEHQLETSAGTHKTEEKYINEMKALIREHEEWVAGRSASQPLVKEMNDSRTEAQNLLDSAQKAHDAMVELVGANAESQEEFLRWEEVRRRSTSRAKRLEDALSSSQAALEFWKGRVGKEDFDDLIIDATRVRNGGQSSKAIIKEKKHLKSVESVESKPETGGEEE